MEKKNEPSADWVRITLRMTPQQRDLLRRAADVAGLPVSDFVLRSACQAAEQPVIEQQSGASSSGVESLPTFTKPARQRWESIPAHMRQRLLSNVWCGHCSHEVAITDINGTMKGRDRRGCGSGCCRSASRHGDWRSRATRRLPRRLRTAALRNPWTRICQPLVDNWKPAGDRSTTTMFNGHACDGQAPAGLPCKPPLSRSIPQGPDPFRCIAVRPGSRGQPNTTNIWSAEDR